MNTTITINPNEDVEIDKYINMLKEKGYGHTLEDQRRRVKAGCIIARHVYKKQIANYDKLVELLKEISDSCVLYAASNWFDGRDKAQKLLSDIEKESA